MTKTDVKTKKLLSLSDIENMTIKESLDMYKKHINPGLGKMMYMLGFADQKITAAKNTTIYLEDGTEILDFTGGVGVLNTGHNHPRIIEARRKWAEQDRMEVWKFFPCPYQSALAKNLAEIFPEDLSTVFFCNSGAEANEGALKMAEKAAGPKRDLTVYTDISFHGKTHATLSLSGSEDHQNHHFKKMPGCIKVPYGNIESLEKVFKENKKGFGKTRVNAFIVEAIRTEGVIVPPEGYFKKVRELCDKYDVTLIMDEVYTGFGRTGKMFAFEHHDIAPDIVSFSKSFGGGKATFAAFVARDRLFKRAYGKMSEATLHSTTFSGFGEELVTAIENINVLYEEKLIENSEIQGKYLLSRLQELQSNHPGMVKDVRAVGLLSCIRFENNMTKIAKMIPGMPSDIVQKVVTGGIITELFEKHKILTFTPPHDFELLLVTPSLTITSDEIDRFVDALDDVLRMNFMDVAMKYVKRFLEK